MDKAKNIAFRIFFSAAMLALLTTCATNGKTQATAEELLHDAPKWEKASWTDSAYALKFDKAGIRYSCVKIDLAAEPVSIQAYPRKEGGKEVSKPIRIKKFVEMTGAKIAINTTPYTKGGKAIGIHIDRGDKLSAEAKRYSALYFEKEEGGLKAKISENQSADDFSEAEFAFGGFFTILKDGEKRSFAHTSYDARSAAGISADGKTLYLLSVEKGFFKRGLSYPECAEILLALGADDAIEFDGGSSTSLFMDGMIDISESPRKNAAYMGLTF